MTTPIHTPIATRYNLKFVVLADDQPEKPAQYTAYDFGYELDADEVGQAMAIEYSNGSFDRVHPVEPDEFEARYHWFLS